MAAFSGLAGLIEPYTSRAVDWIHGQGGAHGPLLIKATAPYVCSRILVGLIAAGIFYAVAPLTVAGIPLVALAAKTASMAVWCFALYVTWDLAFLKYDQIKVEKEARESCECNPLEADSCAAVAFDMHMRDYQTRPAHIVFQILYPSYNRIWRRILG